MNAALACNASGAASGKSEIVNSPIFNRHEEGLLCQFNIHREEEISVTSTLFCGGDWQWQLCSPRGHVLDWAGGFASEYECRESVAMLKNKAAMASVTVFR